ncbi:alpha/beta hydrolase [Rapidithrix thailandica]|uniref:Alpha/beta hydrolase n=1 Tax=Rapidithrix thailandica TaxID=413964 RepID=A0AAW9SIU2_9BACT
MKTINYNPISLWANLFLFFIAMSGGYMAKAQQNAHSSVKKPEAITGYAPVNGLKIYYEVYGKGQPIVLLHGAYMTVHKAFDEMIAALSESRQVILAEMQGHGRTADIDRPITYEFMADDVAALMEYLNIEKADIFGYSMGGGTALQVAIRHPEKVRKLVVASATYQSEGMYPELLKMISTITPEMFKDTPFKKEYDQLAPRPGDWPALVEKLKTLDETPQNWPAESIRSIQSPTMLILGDADVIRPEHTVEMFRLLGGGVMGDITGLPDARLAILPGTTHTGVMEQTDWLLSMIPPFLNVPVTDKVEVSVGEK